MKMLASNWTLIKVWSTFFLGNLPSGHSQDLPAVPTISHSVIIALLQSDALFFFLLLVITMHTTTAEIFLNGWIDQSASQYP